MHLDLVVMSWDNQWKIRSKKYWLPEVKGVPPKQPNCLMLKEATSSVAHTAHFLLGKITFWPVHYWRQLVKWLTDMKSHLTREWQQMTRNLETKYISYSSLETTIWLDTSMPKYHHAILHCNLKLFSHSNSQTTQDSWEVTQFYSFSFPVICQGLLSLSLPCLVKTER